MTQHTPRGTSSSFRLQRAKRLTPAALGICALSLSGCGAAAGGGDAEIDEPIFIGLIAPETGPTASNGEHLINGFQLAIDHLNEEGGVLGHDVEYELVDDRGDAATTAQAAQRLIQQEGVDYLFGTIADDTAIAAAEVAEESEIPFSTAIIADVEQCSPHFWPFGGTPAQNLPHLIPAMLEEHGDNVALVGSDYSFPWNYMAVAEEILEDEGAEVEWEGYSPMGTSDWQPVINNISSAAPDWVLSAVVGGDAVTFVQQADQFGLHNESPITGVSADPDYYPAVGEILEGGITAGAFSADLEGDDIDAFVEAYRDEFGWEGPIPEVAASAYDGVMFIAEVVEAAESREPEDISAQMTEITREGLTGTGAFNEDNHLFSKDIHTFEIQADGVYEPVESFGTVEDTRERDCS